VACLITRRRGTSPGKILAGICHEQSQRLDPVRVLRQRPAPDHEAARLYLVQVLDVKGRTWLDRVIRPVERLTYRVCGIDPAASRAGSATPYRCCSSASWEC